MGLLEALQEVKKENFDPKKDKVGSGFDPIPDGTYTASFAGASHGVWDKSQTDFIRFVFEIATGDQAGRKEQWNPTLASTTSKGKPMPDNVLKRNIKQIQKLGAVVGLDVPDECFLQQTESDDYEKLQEVFLPYKGKMLELTIKSSPNKKDPDHPYRNLSFDFTEQPAMPKPDDKDDPFKDAKTGVEITNNDLPFDISDMK